MNTKEPSVEISNKYITEFGSINVLPQWRVVCPKHGEHSYIIESNIPGHSGSWCQICWVETLGAPLPVVSKPWGESKL